MSYAEFFRLLALRYRRAARRCSDPLLAHQLTVKANKLLSKARATRPDGSVVKFRPKRRPHPE